MAHGPTPEDIATHGPDEILGCMVDAETPQGAVALYLPDSAWVLFATPDWDGTPNTIAFQVDHSDGRDPGDSPPLRAMGASVPWTGDTEADVAMWVRRTTDALSLLLGR